MSGVVWLSRTDCGLAPPNPARLSRRNAADRVWGVTKHHSGGAAPKSRIESRRLWWNLQNDAMSGHNVNGVKYGDIEYNAGFDDFGQILIGRGNEWVGAHATSRSNVANRMTFGIAYLGSADPTPLAMEALRVYVYTAALTIGHAPITLGHTDWSRWGGIFTVCPGPKLEQSHP